MNKDEFNQNRLALMEKLSFDGELLSFDKSDLGNDSVPYLLDQFGGRIRQSIIRIKELVASYPDDAPIEEEVADIEEMLGRAFQTCQSLITDTEGTCLRIHEKAKEKTINGHNGRRWCIMPRCCGLVSGTGYSTIEGIDAAANYYKHEATWIDPWDELKKRGGQQKKTILTIEKLGAKEHSPRNLCQLYSAITGSDDFENVTGLIRILQDWRTALKAEYHQFLIRSKKPSPS